MAIVDRRMHKVLTIEISTVNSFIKLNVPVNSYAVGLYCIRQQPIEALRLIF